jgi:hypothetical protein
MFVPICEWETYKRVAKRLGWRVNKREHRLRIRMAKRFSKWVKRGNISN